MKINIVSFNVNGLKSFSKYISLGYKDFNTYLLSNCIDILCIQESRGLESNLLEFKTLKDYMMFNAFNKKKNGIYGVSTFVRKNLYCSGYKIYISEELKEYCDEGRLLMTEHGDFKILNCYFPYIDDETYYSVVEKRERILRFYNLVGEYLRKNKNIIICGDFNAMYSMMDSFVFVKELKRLCFEKGIEYNFYNIKKIMDNNLDEEKIEPEKKLIYSQIELPYHFYTIESLKEYFFEKKQRKWLYELLKEEYIDCFRVFNKNEDEYTCWNVFLNLRPYNLGTRIDYILIPKIFKNNLIGCKILQQQKGSDHCPIVIEIDMHISKKENNILNRKNNILSFFEIKRK